MYYHLQAKKSLLKRIEIDYTKAIIISLDRLTPTQTNEILLGRFELSDSFSG